MTKSGFLDNAFLWLALSMAILVASPATASDDDQRSAYLIYIDPETGKYTTSDPSKGQRPPAPERPRGALLSESQESSRLPLLLAGALLLVSVGLAAARWRKKHG